MASYSEELIREIRERCDILELVGERVSLKRSGANHMGLCPFHGEKTPSFSVNPAKQIFHCFGCGAGGDAYSFLMRMDGLSFPEAVQALGRRLGMEVDAEEQEPDALKRRKERELLWRINQAACEFYHRTLLEAPEGAPGRRYLRSRGFDGEVARSFLLGFAPPGWEALAGHLASRGFDAKDVQRTGLVRPRNEGSGHYDLFRNRLLFPIQDVQGRVLAFGGRALDTSLPKYINSPESPVYHKGSVLYGLYQGKEAMRKADEAILVEGYFDALALHRAGFAQAVATCGTALTEDQAKLLKKHAARVLTLFDQDRAGEKATDRAMEVFLNVELPAALISLPSGEDPDSFLRKATPEDFARTKERARPLVEAFMDKVLLGGDSGIEERARAAEKVVAVIRQVRSDIERGLYLKRLSERTGLDERMLLRKAPGRAEAPANDARRQEPPVSPMAPRFGNPAPGGRAPQVSGVDKAQALMLQMMLRVPRVRQRVRSDGVESLFCAPELLQLARLILETEEGAEEVDLGALLDRLDEEGKKRLSSLMIQDEELFEDAFDRIFTDCRRAVEKQRLRLRIKELERLRDEAEKAGDQEALGRHLLARARLNNELKKLQ